MQGAPVVTLFTANTGALSARLDYQDGTFLHLHSLVNPENEARYFASVKLWGDRIILAGCGLGYHLSECLASIAPDAKILAIEYHDELVSYSTRKISEIVHNEVSVITGTSSGWKQVLEKFCAGGKFFQVVRHPPSYRAHEAFYRSVLDNMGYGCLSVKKKNSVLLMQGGFFAEQELAAAAQLNGTACTQFWYKENTGSVMYEDEVQRKIETSKPGFILSVNMLGIDSDGVFSGYTQRFGVAVVIWFVDDPRPIMLNRRKLVTGNMIACTWERSYVSFLENCGFAKVNYLPLAADPAQFSVAAMEPPDVELGFIGSSMGKSFLDEIASRCIWKAEYEKIVTVVSDMIVEGLSGDIDNVIYKELYNNSNINRIDEHSLTWLRSYIIHNASMLKRKRCICALQPFGIEVFGDPDGWKQLCRPDIVTHPDLDYRTEIARQYSRIKININVTSCQMSTAVNQRVFDVPLSGSFILNDCQHDLEELFAPDEYAVYQTTDELIDKAAFFLCNENERNAISFRARNHILNEHTYLHRLKKIISMT